MSWTDNTVICVLGEFGLKPIQVEINYLTDLEMMVVMGIEHMAAVNELEIKELFIETKSSDTKSE